MAHSQRSSAYTLNDMYNKWVIRIKFTGSAMVFCMKWWGKRLLCSFRCHRASETHTYTRAHMGFGGDSIIFGVGTHTHTVPETRLLTHGYGALQQVALGSVCKRKQRTTALRLTHISLLMFIALRFAVTRLRHCHRRRRRRRSRSNVTSWMKRLQYVTPTTSGGSSSSSNGDGNGGGTVARIQIEI